MNNIDIQSKQYDFFISYTRNDISLAEQVARRLEEYGLYVFRAKNLFAGVDFNKAIVQTIRNAKALIVIASNDYFASEWCQQELQMIINTAECYDRKVFVLVNKENQPKVTNTPLDKYQWLYIEDGDVSAQCQEIAKAYDGNYRINSLYHKLSQYIAINEPNRVFATIQEIMEMSPRSIDVTYYSTKPEMYEFFSLLKVLDKTIPSVNWSKIDVYPYAKIHSHLSKFISSSADNLFNRKGRELNVVNVAILLYAAIVKNRLENKTEPSKEEDDIKLLIERFEPLIVREISIECDDQEKEVIGIVIDAKNKIKKEWETPNKFDKKYESNNEDLFDNDDLLGDITGKPESVSSQPSSIDEDETESTLEAKLFEIAEHINKGNQLFESIDGLSGTEGSSDFLKCLQASYERLKNYSDIVGCKKVSIYCIERLDEINYKLSKLINPIQGNDLKENSIKALLGFTLPNSGKFDVFLSHHRDDDLVENVYSFLKQNLYEPFYDKKSLPEMGESQYKKAIGKALDASETLIVVASNLEFLESTFVGFEMDSFHTEIIEKRKPHGKILFLLTDDVKQKIEANKMILDVAFRGCEIIAISEYRVKLLPYLKKKNN